MGLIASLPIRAYVEEGHYGHDMYDDAIQFYFAMKWLPQLKITDVDFNPTLRNALEGFTESDT